jgi:acetoin utilization protein AcuB
MFIRNHMTHQSLTVTLETPLYAVADEMAHHQARHVPVVDDGGHVVGLISRRELCIAISRDSGDALQDEPVGRIMSPAIIVAADAPLCTALALLCETGAEALPVLQNGRVVGVICRHDLLLVMHRLLGLNREGSCIELALEDTVEDVAAAVEVVRKRGVRLLSAIASCVRDDGDQPALYLRVDATDPRSLESALKREGLILLVPENEGPASPAAGRRASSGDALCELDGMDPRIRIGVGRRSSVSP